MSITPNVECERHHTIIQVDDINAAIDFYTKKLGFWLAFKWGDPVTMAGVNLGKHAQIFLQLGTSKPDGCEMYFVIGDADELYEFQRANGVEVIWGPGDRNYGLRDYGVRDLYGYKLSFGHRLPECDPEE